MLENNRFNYGQPFDYAAWFRQNEFKKKQEKKEIRRLGFYGGAAILLMILLQNAIVILLQIVGLYDDYLHNTGFQMGMDILIPVISTLFPFLLFSIPMKKQSGIQTVAPLEKPNDFKLSVYGVSAGLGFCMAANIVTGYFTVFISLFGFELSAPELPESTGTADFFVSLIRVVLVAALVEEISLRGCIMQPLRKYGDNFAIIMSACTFGLMHCNLIQAPFALIAGIALGFVAIKTGSLWTAIIVHALNNLIAQVFSYLSEVGISEKVTNTLYIAIVYVCIAVGIFAYILFEKRAKQVSPTVKDTSSLAFFQKAFAYIGNPTMIIAIILMLIVTANFVKRV